MLQRQTLPRTKYGILPSLW